MAANSVSEMEKATMFPTSDDWGTACDRASPDPSSPRLWLAVAGFAIAVLSFRHLGFLAARPLRRPTPPQHSRLQTVRRIRWAILATARLVPWRAVCFQQGIAAQLMLRRRGIPSVLFYGAAQDELAGLFAHVWVRDRDVNVVGGEIAHRFAMLATFPPQP